jgi:hypothetical protein
MAELAVHIDELVLPGGPPEPAALAAALAEHLGDRLSADVLSQVGQAVVTAIADTGTGRVA